MTSGKNDSLRVNGSSFNFESKTFFFPMKPAHALSSLIALSLALASCGGKDAPTAADRIKQGNDFAAEQAKKAAEQAAIDKMEAEAKELAAAAKKKAKEAAQQAVVAPAKRGEFPLTITPDSKIKSSYSVPVHVFSVSPAGAASWRGKSTDAYWKSPNPDAQVTFGSKSGAKQSTFATAAPFRAGEQHVVVIVKMAGVTRPEVFELKRKPNPVEGLPPIVSPLKLRLTPGGIQVQ